MDKEINIDKRDLDSIIFLENILKDLKINNGLIKYIDNLNKDSKFNGAKWSQINRIKNNFKKFNSYVKKYLKKGDIICDIGAGNGYFLWIFKNLYDCKIHGIDVKDTNDAVVHHIIRKAIGVEDCIEYESVEAMVPMKLFNKKFNLITAILTVFNRDSHKKTYWTTENWEFFLNDISDHLDDGGYFIMRPNGLESFLELYKSFNLKNLKLIEKLGDFVVYQKTQ